MCIIPRIQLLNPAVCSAEPQLQLAPSAVFQIQARFLLTLHLHWVWAHCKGGLTEVLLSTCREQGFNLIAFPCNQFGGQAPESSDGERKIAIDKFQFEFPIMVGLIMAPFCACCVN